MNTYIKYMVNLERGEKSEQIALSHFKHTMKNWSVKLTEHYDVLDLYGVDVVAFNPTTNQIQLMQIKSSMEAAIDALEYYEDKHINVYYVRQGRVNKVGNKDTLTITKNNFKTLAEKLNK